MKRLALALVLVVLLVSGCAAAQSPRSSNEMEAPPAQPALPESDSYSGNRGLASPQEMPAAAPAEPSAGVPNLPLEKRMVLRNANLAIVVDDPAQAMNAVMRLAESMNGYVVSSNLQKISSKNGREYPEANVTIRVPAEKLSDAMDQIKALVKDPKEDIRSENISGQDVTKEYTDLKSRLTNLEEAEKQLREIMGSATKTEDVLAVYNQLIQIREQIEVIQGQIKYYEESAALSSISVQIQAQEAAQPLEIGSWQPVGVARDAIQALIDTAQVLGSVVIWLILYVLPIVLVIFLPLRGLWLLFRRFRKNRKPVVQPPTPPESS